MSKEEKYAELLRELRGWIDGSGESRVSILANASALVRERMGWFWVGFYMVEGDVLRLGPFQGPAACYRIGYGRGVCGTAWARGESIVVPDVEAFEGHIACSSLSRSEIVVPLFDGVGRVVGVLDIDSTEPDTFDDTDRQYLESACRIIERNI